MPTINAHVARRPKQGMIVRSIIEIGPGKWLSRLAHRTVRGTVLTDEQAINGLEGSWWIARDDYQEIARRAAAAGSKLSDVWRQYGAIAKRWGGSADLLIEARTAVPLTAYIGPGTIQDLRDESEGSEPGIDQPVWIPPPHITQIWLPGLSAKTADGRCVIGTLAFDKVRVGSVDA